MTGGDVTPGQPDPFGEYADDFGSVSSSPWDLTEDEEAYRAAAYEKVLHYARDYGLEIFPVHWMKDKQSCSCRQGELCEPRSMGKHPVDLRWPEMATSDPEHAARWWRPPEPDQTLPCDWRPRANIGYRTGGGRFITDVDTDDGKQGADSLAALVEQGGGEAMPPTLCYQTGGGGTQHVTLAPKDVEVRNSASKIAPGIDIRGYNGYGILPPSRSAKGEYVMLIDRSPDVSCPGWEADWLREQHRGRTEHIASHPCGDPRQIPADGLTKRAHAYLTSAFKDAVATVAAAPDGKRNQALNDECFDMFAKFVPAGLLSADDVAAAMQEAGESCGLEPKAVYATIMSAREGGQRKDRTAELPDFLFEEPGQRSPAPDKPEPLTDITTPWLPKDPAVTITGLDSDGRVSLDGDVKKDNSPFDVLRLAWAVALGHASPHVAVKGGDLVVVSGAEQGSLNISELDARRLRSLCANGLTYYHNVKEREKDNGDIEVEEWDEPAIPSMQLCGTVLADPAIRLYRPVLAGISRVPVLRPDRTLLERQGVDPVTMRVYWPDLPIGPIPARPSRSEVAAAKKLILDQLLHDFPWASDVDKANCLGMLLTSYLQPYKEFLSPLFILNAPKAGSGKGNLVTVMAETTGAHFRTWVNGEEEIRKSLTTVLRENDPCIIFDDVDADDIVKSATLASALTRHQWDDRLLGGNKNFRGVNNRVWCLTGNHVRLGGDIPSRSVLVHLNPGPTDPKKRLTSSFKLGDFDPWIRREENRVRVIRALLTLITAWVDHGAVESTVHHRFAGWAAVTGGVLEHHGIEGFLANQAEIDDRVERDESLADFLACWYSIFKSVPQQVSKVRESLSAEPELGNEKLWKGTWPKNKKNQLVSARGLADMLRRVQSQDMGGYQVDVAKDDHDHDVFYVTPIDTPIDITESDQNSTT